MIYNYAASTRHQNLCKISRPKLLGSILQICLLQSVIKWYSGEMVPRGTPLPTRHVRSPLTTAQRAPCQKRGFDAARYQVARKRGSARRLSLRYSLNAMLHFPCNGDNVQFSIRIRMANAHHSPRSRYQLCDMLASPLSNVHEIFVKRSSTKIFRSCKNNFQIAM